MYGCVKDATLALFDAQVAGALLLILVLTELRGETHLMAKKEKAAQQPSKPQSKSAKPKLPKKKSLKPRKKQAVDGSSATAQVLSSEVVYSGPLFRVVQDKVVEPGSKQAVRDVVRHNGSAVILAIDSSKSRKDPWIVMERQYRHAANRFLWELPAGKLEQEEDPLAGAQRELEEETGYRAKKWRPLVEYFASPGFLGEAMKVFLAEGLTAGEARPEDDEQIEIRLVKLSDVLAAIQKGEIMDGKTLSAVLFYAHAFGKKRGK
jgi:ADP-ribose pyrophosphatase